MQNHIDENVFADLNCFGSNCFFNLLSIDSLLLTVFLLSLVGVFAPGHLELLKGDQLKE